jgi:hypothetical protein
MSVILAYATKDSIYMGADRVVVIGDEVQYGCKVTYLDSCIMGTSGTRDLWCNIKRIPPPIYIPENYMDGFNEYVCTTLHEWGKSGVFDCGKARAILGFLPPNESPQLVEVAGEMSKNWFDIELINTSISPYISIGSGSSICRAAFDVLLDRDDLSVKEKIDRAIKATCKTHLYTRPDLNGNIDVLYLHH